MITNSLPSPTDLPAIRAWLAMHAPDVDAVRVWSARQLADITGPVPDLGTREWLALPEHDPRKFAATLRPAVAYLAEGTPDAIAARLRRELDDFATAVRRMFADAAAEVSAYARQHRLDGYGTGPTHAELVRRRNTHTCGWCGATRYGSAACPNGCGTPEHIRAQCAADLARVDAEIAQRHRRAA